MWRTALRSLAFDRTRVVIAVLGVAFASMLSLVQAGIYAGFLEATSAVVTHVGGDLWVMARGTELLENGDPLSPASRVFAASDPCVRRVRGVIVSFALTRTARGGLLGVQVIGFEPGEHPVPWSLARGLPSDLHAPGSVALDEYDLAKLQIRGDPIGSTFDVAEQPVKIVALTRGVRSFVLAPNLFAEIETARRLTRIGPERAHFWVLDLHDRSCAATAAARIDRHPDLQAMTTADFRGMTQRYWVSGSGAGTVLALTALLGLLVGLVVVGQTLLGLVKASERELAVLKTIGATPLELGAFVAWQVAAIAALGCALGALGALGVRAIVGALGLRVLLTAESTAIAIGVSLVMCAVASLAALRKVVRLETMEVFR